MDDLYQVRKSTDRYTQSSMDDRMMQSQLNYPRYLVPYSHDRALSCCSKAMADASGPWHHGLEAGEPVPLAMHGSDDNLRVD